MEGIQARCSESYAPSWSWASVVGGQLQLSIPHERWGELPSALIRLVDARIVPEPAGGDPTGLLRSAELDIECMLFYYRWVGQTKKLVVYSDEGGTRYFDTTSDLRLDTSDLVERFAQMDEIRGVCVPICGAYLGYGGGENEYLVLEHEASNKFRRIGMMSAGGIGNWIRCLSKESSRITLI